MNEPKFDISKMNYDSKPKIVLKIHKHNHELEPIKNSFGAIRSFRKFLLRLSGLFKSQFKNKSDLTFDQWQRLESKPKRQSEYK